MEYFVKSDQITMVTAPVVEPISLQQAKTHLRVDGTESNTEISAMIVAARQWIEKTYQMSLVQRTYRADVEGFSDVYHLPRGPLLSLTSVYYYTDDSPQVLTLLSGYYTANPGKGQIYLDASQNTIPNVAPRHDAVQITWVAGYDGNTDSPVDYAANVPHAIQMAMLLLVGELYEHRTINAELTLSKTNTLEMLLSPYREIL